MSDAGIETLMGYYECMVCGCHAVCVANEAADRAWADHMDGHPAATHYRAVFWTSVQLPLS